MQLEFVPVEDFYFALTLCSKPLEDFGDVAQVEVVRAQLQKTFGQASTVAAAKQNNFNYTFRVLDVENPPSPQLVVAIADWQDKLRLSSDYGWTLNEDRKPRRTDYFDQRNAFCAELKIYFRAVLGLSL